MRETLIGHVSLALDYKTDFRAQNTNEGSWFVADISILVDFEQSPSTIGVFPQDFFSLLPTKTTFSAAILGVAWHRCLPRNPPEPFAASYSAGTEVSRTITKHRNSLASSVLLGIINSVKNSSKFDSTWGHKLARLLFATNSTRVFSVLGVPWQPELSADPDLRRP